MSDYKRFISYIYEYINQKKAANRGFVKVESRPGMSRLQFQINVFSLPAQSPLSVYGYHHAGDSLPGQLLGKLHATQSGIHECITLQPTESTQKDPLAPFDGLILLDPTQGRFFATQWDDIPVIPRQFQEESAAKPVPPQPEPTQNTEEKVSSSSVSLEEPEEPASPPEISAESMDSNPDLTAEKLPPKSSVWTQLQEKFPRIQPFDDEEFSDCLQIKLQDFPYLRELGFQISCSQFICRSFQCYHHLLLACMEMEKTPTFLLGIPGIYNENELFLAQLYGFRHFKQGRLSTDSDNHKRGGYWYRPLSCCN
ncbi:MAG: DUF6128 domain-containing protein [Lachnospiraceae bacterium]|nr:DUF6128 domain-containing protein [Lachnospiraceae bacterium]